MSDDFDDLLKRWLRDRGATDRSAIGALAGHVAVLPPRRGRRRQVGPLAAAAAIIAAVGLAAFALVPRQGSVTSSPSAPLPPDPAAFAGDPRLARCGATADSALDAFEMAHARDYHLHLPAMLLAPELDVDAPAFVVVYREMQSFPGGAPPPAGQTWPPRSLAPGLHDICVLVGADPTTSERNVYDNVDTAGLTASVDSGPLPSPSDRPPTTPAPGSDGLTTPAPAPAWAADLAGQLQCDGPVAGIGGEVPSGASPEALGATPEAAVLAFLGPSNHYASLPAGGFAAIHADSHWASFGYAVSGRPKAIVVVSDIHGYGTGWTVMGLRACDPSEFDPSTPLTFPMIVWTDVDGRRVSTDMIHSFPGPAHCGWESSIWLRVGDDLYFRDPEGVMAQWTRTRFAADVALPADAVDSGYRSGERALRLVPKGDAYVVSPSGVERWPRSTDPFIGCA